MRMVDQGWQTAQVGEKDPRNLILDIISTPTHCSLSRKIYELNYLKKKDIVVKIYTQIF
jgi:hypothetical protein